MGFAKMEGHELRRQRWAESREATPKQRTRLGKVQRRGHQAPASA